MSSRNAHFAIKASPSARNTLRTVRAVARRPLDLARELLDRRTRKRLSRYIAQNVQRL
jgi:hypothetical protein